MSRTTPKDKLARLRVMADDNGQTWDLSHNDQEAIRFALRLINELADTLAVIKGHHRDLELEWHCNLIANGTT